VPVAPVLVAPRLGPQAPRGDRSGLHLGTGLIVAGAAMFGVSYLLFALPAIEGSGSGLGAVPIAGPPLVLDETYGSADAGLTAVYWLGAVAQTVGLSLLIAGIIGRVTWTDAPAPDQVTALPWAGPDGSGGLRISGIF
jgi:hypothetical protein